MMAEALGRKRGWSLGEVAYLHGAQSYARCARDALLRREPEIRYTGPDPSRFDMLVLVSPVWCWRLSPPMRRCVRSLPASLDKVAMLSCMGGSGAANAVAEVERLIRRPVVARVAFRQDEVERGRHSDPMQAFADEVAVQASAGRRLAMPDGARPAQAAVD
jgi:hypothetical protein